MPNNTYTVLKPFHLSAREQAAVGDTVKLEPRQARDELAKGRVAPKGKAAAAVAASVPDAPKAKKA
jgi:hypothetical protein